MVSSHATAVIALALLLPVASVSSQGPSWSLIGANLGRLNSNLEEGTKLSPEWGEGSAKAVVTKRPSTGLLEFKAKSGLTFDEEAAKQRPVTKVIQLLKDMQKQLEQEAEEDEEIYEKMACWCETNDKEKTKAIADGEAHINDLTALIEESSMKSAKLNTEIKNLGKEVKENQEALDKATAMREKDLAEFNQEEKDNLQAISALKSAIITLSKNHEGGAVLLQTFSGQMSATGASSQMAKAASVAKHILTRHASLFEGVLTASQKRKVMSFMQQPQNAGSYAPQSGAIFGILKQMKETFETNMEQSQKEELEGQKAYEDLKQSKEEEIAAGNDQIETKTQELAKTDETLEASKIDLADTRETLKADEAFLMMLKETCQAMDMQWEQRQKDRQLELEAVSKAIAILNSDEAHETFTKTFNPTFAQKDTISKSQRRRDAAKLLSAVGRANKSPRLVALATRVRLDAFTKVKKAIDDMIAALLKEKEDEIKLKDFCTQGFNENLRNTERKELEKKDLKEKIDGLTMTIDELENSIETLKAEIVEMQTQMKRAGEDREKENKEFQQTVADQKATVKILDSVLNVLKAVYDKKAKAAVLVQEKGGQPAGPPPPPGFKKMKKNQAGTGVVGMIQGIIDEAKMLEEDARKAEEDAQTAYEDFVKETDAAIAERSKDIVNKSDEKATAEGDKTQAEEDREGVMLDLDGLANEALDLHQTCDFVMKNFDIRQTARDDEIEAIKQAKAILSGAKFSFFIQESDNGWLNA